MALRRPGAVAIVGNRPFVAFALTQAVSLFGDKLDYMALLALFAWLAATRGTDVSRAISALAVVAALPTVLFAPLAGVVVDRVDRRRLMIVCDSARALLVGLLPLVAVRTGSLVPVFALAFLVFLGGIFFHSARLAVIPGLAAGPGDSRSSLLAANSLMSLTGRVATLGGMVLGGFAVDWPGWHRIGIRPSWSAGFYLDALTYLVSVVGILLVYRRLGETSRPLDSPAPRSPFLSSFRSGWRYAVSTPPVLFVYAAVLALVIAGAGFVVLYVPLIQGSAPDGGFGLGTRGVGLVAAVGSAGLILSSVGYGLLGHRVAGPTAMLASFFVLGGIATALPFVRNFAVLAPLVFIGGLALSPLYIAMDTLLHETVPAGARGRVFANREWLTHLALAAGALVIGQLTRLVGNREILLVIGLIVLALTAAGVFAAARVRRWQAEVRHVTRSGTQEA